MRRMRICAFKELVKTEQTYRDNILKMIYYRSRMLEKKVISKKEADNIFGNIQDIFNINKVFLQSLENLEADLNANFILKTFQLYSCISTISPYFKLYNTY